ncbi:hypothetical protein Xenpb_00844 [Xenorhabdus sp. PB62.4]|nr:hypothetical protein [Xenorhabdus sp. PB62.4]
MTQFLVICGKCIKFDANNLNYREKTASYWGLFFAFNINYDN